MARYPTPTSFWPLCKSKAAKVSFLMDPRDIDQDSSPVRRGFRLAIAEAMEYQADSMDRRPAFLTPLPSISRPQRSHLRDLPGPITMPAGRGLTLASALEGLEKGAVSSFEMVQSCLDAIDQREPELNAFVYQAPAEQLLAQAAQLDAERKAGRVRGRLHGIPVSVKDVIAVAAMPNTACSRVLEGVVAQQDAASVYLLRREGAIIFGKTQTHEFALGVTTPQSRNPWDPSRDPGGSSGGSAISVATGMSLASLGTDTRASIRVPSALCGVVGFKPTYGLVSTDGVITLSWSLDHVGPITRTVGDAAIMLDVLTSAASPWQKGSPGYTEYLRKDCLGMRVGLPVHSLTDADAEVLKALRESVYALKSCGVSVVEIEAPTSPDLDRANSMGLIVSRCEAANYHRGFNADTSLYTRQVYEQLDEASQLPAMAYLQAQRFRGEFQHRMLELLEEFDALMMPTCRVAAPEREEVEKYFLVLSLNCVPWSFIGFPAVSVPGGFTATGLPVGMELVAAPFEDGRLLVLAGALESALAGKDTSAGRG